MKRILSLILAGALAKTASGISPIDVNELEGLVKKDPNSLKGVRTINGGQTDFSVLTINELTFTFYEDYLTISRKNDDEKTTFYDLEKDGIPDGVSFVGGIKIPNDSTLVYRDNIDELRQICSGNLEEIQSDLEFADMFKRLGRNETNFLFGISPNNKVVVVDFKDGELSKKLDPDFKLNLNQTYNTLMRGLRKQYTSPKDALYKGGKNDAKR